MENLLELAQEYVSSGRGHMKASAFQQQSLRPIILTIPRHSPHPSDFKSITLLLV